jgi:hypothetical protein
MKKYISAVILISIFAFISCAHKANIIDYKSATYDTSKQITVFYIIDLKPIKYDIAPGKRVTRHYFAQDTSKTKIVDGNITVPVKPIIDTIYLIATIDSTLTLNDSSGKKILDPKTKLPQYLPSFRKPLTYPTSYAQEINILSFNQVK